MERWPSKVANYRRLVRSRGPVSLSPSERRPLTSFADTSLGGSDTPSHCGGGWGLSHVRAVNADSRNYTSAPEYTSHKPSSPRCRWLFVALPETSKLNESSQTLAVSARNTSCWCDLSSDHSNGFCCCIAATATKHLRSNIKTICTSTAERSGHLRTTDAMYSRSA